jgi:hypothetical protein
MIDHTTISHLLLSRESMLQTLFDAIDSAVEMDQELPGSSILSIHLEHIKHLAEQCREAAN